MDSILRDMEKHMAQNGPSVKLNQDIAERYLEVTIASIFTENSVEDNQLLASLGYLAELAEDELWSSRISELFLSALRSIILDRQRENAANVNASLSILMCLANVGLKDGNDNHMHLIQFCKVFQPKDTLLVQFLDMMKSNENNNTILIKLVKYLCLHIDCLLQWMSFDDIEAPAIATATNVMLKQTGVLNELSRLLYLKQGHKELRELIGHQFVNRLKRLKYVLAGFKAVEYELEETALVKEWIHKLFEGNEAIKRKFIESNETHTDFQGLSILHLLNLRFTLIQDNLTLKKAFTEQLLFHDYPIPLLETVCRLVNFILDALELASSDKPTIQNAHFVLNMKEILVALLRKTVNIWEKSKSQNFEDLSSILELVKILFYKCSDACEQKTNLFIETFINICEETTYENLRTLQVEQWKKKQYKNWSKDINSFNEILCDQVQEFVRYQRLLIMQKGTWVYSENPTENKHKLPKVAFIALSDNQMNLLSREFKHKMEKSPTVEDNEIVLNDPAVSYSRTTVIPLKNIANIKSKQIEIDRNMPEGSRLINLLKNTVYTEVAALDRNGKVLTLFFLESAKSFYTWLDGLQLLSQSKNAHLSMETQNQIDMLTALKRNAQLAALDDNLKGVLGLTSMSDDEEDQEYYNVDVLRELSNNVFYE